jgi:hypothetical protein
MPEVAVTQACEYVKHLVSTQGKPWPVAIALAAEEYNTTTGLINTEFRQRKANRWNGPPSPCCGKAGRRLGLVGMGIVAYACPCGAEYRQ